MPTGYGDAEADYLYRCSRCDAARGLTSRDYQDCFWRYIKRMTTLGEPVIPIRNVLYWRFDWEFQKRWVQDCSCGGKFEQRFIKLTPKCTHCGIVNLGWLPWPVDEIPSSVQLPALIYSIPGEYQSYDTSEPAWLLEQSKQYRSQWDRAVDRIPERLRKVLAILFLVLILGFGKVLMLLTSLFGFVTNTNQCARHMRELER